MAKRTRPWPARNPICIATLDEHGNAVCACPTEPVPSTPVTPTDAQYDDAIGETLFALLGRRRFLAAAAGGVTSLLLAACSAANPASTTASTSSIATKSVAAASSSEKPLWVYVFNVGTKDVTIINAATNKVLATRPLGAAVRWLSNEQRYWDGEHIWTYDFPNNNLVAIAIDPKAIKVVETVETGTKGPGHSLMLSPDLKSAYVNSAGSNVIDVIDVASKKVRDKIEVGSFPCDCFLSPDGKFGYTPERDQDTVAKFDTTTNKIVQRIDFPKGSKPYMLRVSPDGKELRVQAAGNNTNNILDPDNLKILYTETDGKGPVTNAWSPDGKYVLVTHEGDTIVSVYSTETKKIIKTITVGQGSSNIGFTPDGKKAFVSVTGANSVAVIDMASLSVAQQITTGKSPQGLIVFPAPEGGLS
ncbi:MAG: YncE family protein [Chloroflexi bacterium]|nr:YncE family protein [Chloroflexota bacterium]